VVFDGENPSRPATGKSLDQWLTWKHASRTRQRLFAGRAPDKPAPRAADLDWGDQAVLEATIRLIAPVAANVVAFFYDELFARQPGVRHMFPADLSAQQDRLLVALLALVAGGTNPAGLMRELEQLGRDHRKYGVRPAQYRAVGDALIVALARFAGPHWTAEAERAWLARYSAAAEVMMRAAEADRRPPFWYATVVGSEMCGPDVAILVVRPQQPYPYVAGQYATLESPRLPRVWRPYSMATAPRADQLLEFHIRAIGRGGLSDVLVSTPPGDVVRIGPPQGTVTLAAAAGQASLFIAGGTGWSTVKALLGERARDHRLRFASHLLVGCRHGEPYDPRFADFVGRLPETGTTVVHNSAELLAELAPNRLPTRNLDVFVSGPPGLVRATTSLLAAAGVKRAHIHHDALLLT
jgi:ferredoxin-NADP reductase/hemoglobin-like flavoprotein